MADLVDYWLTFRIENVNIAGVTPGQRRDALYEAVNNICSSWWTDPTSFILFDSTKEIDAIAAKCEAAISPSHDLVLIRVLNAKTARSIGKTENAEMLKAFMPYLTET